MALDYRRILYGPEVPHGRRRPGGRSSAMLIAFAMIMLILLAAVPLLMDDKIADNLGTAFRYGVAGER